MSATTLLVTGAAGWLGVNLVQALQNGLPGCAELPLWNENLHVVCLVPPGVDGSALENSGVTLVRGDLRNAADCDRFCAAGADAVLLHTAGVIHPDRVQTFYDINVLGTANLLEAACRAGVRRVVAVSSNSVCGVNPHADHRFDEDSPYQPYMHYGRSKMFMEQLVHSYHENERIETVLIRCPWFYGPNQPARQALFFRMIQEGKVPLVGPGTNRRSMVYLDNLTQGILRAACVPLAVGQTYWIADATPYTMNEIIDTIEHLLEDEFGQTCAHKRIRLPALVSELAWCADWCLQALGFYQQKIHVLSEMNKTIACSVAKARRELGYQPQIALEEGMRRSLESAYAQGLLTRAPRTRHTPRVRLPQHSSVG